MRESEQWRRVRTIESSSERRISATTRMRPVSLSCERKKMQMLIARLRRDSIRSLTSHGLIGVLMGLNGLVGPRPGRSVIVEANEKR